MNGTELVKLIDTTLCTACRGCQVACKQWNVLPGLRTKQLRHLPESARFAVEYLDADPLSGI